MKLKLLDIETVARISGLNAFTLRNWERRYAFPIPERTAQGQRAYSFSQVQVLRTIAQLMDRGHKASILCEKAKNGEPLESPKTVMSPLQLEQIEAVYKFLTSYDLENAENAIANLQLGLPTRLALEQVYLPLLERLGAEWSASKICIAQEHFASNFLRLRIAPLLITSDIRVGNRKKVLCATLENELHEGGLLLLSAQMKIRNWSVYYMGASLPPFSLQRACSAIKPEVVCLSFANEELLFSNLDALGKIKSEIYIGGRGVHGLDQKRLPENVIPLQSSTRDAADLLTEIYRD